MTTRSSVDTTLLFLSPSQAETISQLREQPRSGMEKLTQNGG
jgi:hypothetical protein